MSDNLRLVLDRRRQLTPEIVEFTFSAFHGEVLPSYQAGAHLDVRTPSGAWRSYSLCGDDTKHDRYTIAVKREEAGRGGSLSMHRLLVEGDVVEARAPSNAFALASAAKYLLIAGGIGITPIISMYRTLVRREADVRLVYLTRDPSMAAYVDVLAEHAYARHAIVHHSYGDPKRSYDFWPWLETPEDRHVYFCGPARLMDQLYLQTIHWPRSMVHYESFEGIVPIDGHAAPFTLRRAATGEEFEVPADSTVLEVLRSRGIALDSSCESGTCGTCRMRLVEGRPDHRDAVLSEDARRAYFMPCVSRAEGVLTLDF